MFEQLNNWFECDVVMFLASLAIALLILPPPFMCHSEAMTYFQ